MFAHTVRELVASAARWETWSALAVADTRSRYRRTMIGPLWQTLSMGVMVGSVGIVYAGLFGAELSDYLPHFGIGLIVWTLISTSTVEGCSVFISASGYIKSVPLPLSMHVYRLLARNTIILAHNLILIVLLWLIFRWSIGPGMVFAAFGLAINLVALTGITLVLGVLCARFRDIPQIIMALMQLLFLLTPIVWLPTALKSPALAPVIYWNPVYILIEVVRGPLLGQLPAIEVWIKAILLASVALALGIVIYEKFRWRVAYWL